MKILFFSPYFYPYVSGLTNYPKKLFEFLSKDHKITVLTFSYKKNWKNFYLNKNLKIIYIPYLFRISKGFISPQSIYFFYKYSLKSDLIFLNLPNFEGLFLGLIGKFLRKKICSLFHCQVFLPKGFFNKIINFFLNLSVYLQMSFSQKIFIYTINYFSSLSFFKKFINKTIQIYPPIENLLVDKSYFLKLIKDKKNKYYIGYSGRISNEKGLEYLIEAISLIKNKKITLLFAGPYGKMVAGENDYFLRIKKLLKDKKIDYIFLGTLKHKQLGAFYKAIDLLVLPSINSTEAFGMVQAEAMMLETPVIASNLPGVNVPINLTKMGLLVEPKNTYQLKKAILTILNNRKKFTNKKLIEKAKKIFDIKKVYQFYEKIFKSI